MNIYIKAATAISPQESFESAHFLEEIFSTKDGFLQAREANYAAYIPPVPIRRMSRILKMGISAAMEALQQAKVASPDAVIIGTAKGSVSDLEHTLEDMRTLNEEAMNPTYFIQSTYNAVNGWIAKLSNATGYNQTFVHKGNSFEWALRDAALFLSEKTVETNVLAGCYDEMTSRNFTFLDHLRHWKKPGIISSELLQNSDTAGTIAGEGTAFFVLSNSAENCLAKLAFLEMIPEVKSKSTSSAIDKMLANLSLQPNEIDAIITGRNGSSLSEDFYRKIESKFPVSDILAFKHLTGEYDTTGGFALWLATFLLQQDAIPEPLIFRKISGNKPTRILIVNHFFDETVGVMLVEGTK